MSVQHWSVTVDVNGEKVLTIESNSLCGKSDLSETELRTIRQAANHLLSFAGRPSKHQANEMLRQEREFYRS